MRTHTHTHMHWQNTMIAWIITSSAVIILSDEEGLKVGLEKRSIQPEDTGYLNGFLVKLNLPDVVQSEVHRSSVVELLLKLHSLPRHLDADKHMQQGLRQVRHQRVCLECLLSCIPTKNNKQYWSCSCWQTRAARSLTGENVLNACSLTYLHMTTNNIGPAAADKYM